MQTRIYRHSGDTAKDLAAVIGKTGTLQTDNLSFDVEIHNVKQAFGRTDYLVKPVAGSGEVWVSSARVTVN